MIIKPREPSKWTLAGIAFRTLLSNKFELLEPRHGRSYLNVGILTDVLERKLDCAVFGFKSITSRSIEVADDRLIRLAGRDLEVSGLRNQESVFGMLRLRRQCLIPDLELNVHVLDP